MSEFCFNLLLLLALLTDIGDDLEAAGGGKVVL